MSDPSSNDAPAGDPADATPASDEATETPAVDQPSGDEGKSDDRGDLGDAGKKALADERKAAKAARSAEKAATARAAELEKQLAGLTEASQSEQEKALGKATKEAAEAARAEVLTELHAERKTNALLKAAAGKLADPEDAVSFLLAEIEVDAAGHPDGRAVAKAVDDLLKVKPHLKANRINGAADGGPRGDDKPADNDMNALLRRQLGR